VGSRFKQPVGMLVFAAVTAAGIAAAMALDKTVHDLAVSRHPKFVEFDLHRMLRVTGYLPVWLIGGAMLLAMDWPLRKSHGIHRWITRGTLLAAAPTASGAMAEALKWWVGRARPPREWTGQWIEAARQAGAAWYDTSGLAFPSSHAAVAFGAAFAMRRLFPAAGWLALAMAVGCGWTRIASRAHALSDVAAGAATGYAAAWMVWAVHRQVKRAAEGPSAGEP
jgi:membrane-associated phospholipid phosphatase